MRAGEYIRQPGGYRAFVPKDLPPDPGINYDTELWSLLSQADRALGRLDGSTSILPNLDLFLFMYVRKEAVLSSQIEGTQASLIDVLEFESEILENPDHKDVAEVVNYIGAMNYGLQRIKTLPLSLRLIKEIHGELLRGVRGGERNPGEFRATQNWIGPKGCTLATATYVPPPVPEMYKSLDNLEKFLHDESPMPVLIRIGLAHAHFETIHPFLDGNGRIGRLLITFLLCQQGILKRPLLYLSHFFKLNRTEYYDRLQDIRDKGNWEGWLKFFLKGVYEVSQQATDTAQRIVNMLEEHRQLVMQHFGGNAGTALGLLEHLYQRPVVTVKTVSQFTGLTFPNASNLVARLENIGLLYETTGQRRNRRFSYQPYLDLFSSDEPSGESAPSDEWGATNY